MLYRILLLASTILLAFSSVAQAGLITFEFSGTITEVRHSEFTDGSVATGTPVHGWYEFDLNTVDSADTNLNFGWYLNQNDNFSATVGNYTLLSGLAHDIWNDINGHSGTFDEYSLGVLGPRTLSNGVDSITTVTWSLDFFTYNTTFLTSISLPSTPPDITLSDTRMVILGNDSLLEEFTFVANIDRLSLRVIPEPSTLALIALGLLGFGYTHRKKQ